MQNETGYLIIFGIFRKIFFQPLIERQLLSIQSFSLYKIYTIFYNVKYTRLINFPNIPKFY